MKTWLTSAVISILSIFAPAKELFIAAGVLIALDLATGIYAALKTEQPITSAGLRRTVSKFFIYNVAIGAGFLVEHYMMKGAIPVSNIVASAIGMTELKSILENLDKIQGGSLVRQIIEKLGSVNDTHKDTQK